MRSTLFAQQPPRPLARLTTLRGLGWKPYAGPIFPGYTRDMAIEEGPYDGFRTFPNGSRLDRNNNPASPRYEGPWPPPAAYQGGGGNWWNTPAPVAPTPVAPTPTPPTPSTPSTPSTPTPTTSTPTTSTSALDPNQPTGAKPIDNSSARVDYAQMQAEQAAIAQAVSAQQAAASTNSENNTMFMVAAGVFVLMALAGKRKRGGRR